jgi:hypothetical protein
MPDRFKENYSTNLRYNKVLRMAGALKSRWVKRNMGNMGTGSCEKIEIG